MWLLFITVVLVVKMRYAAVSSPKINNEYGTPTHTELSLTLSLSDSLSIYIYPSISFLPTS